MLALALAACCALLLSPIAGAVKATTESYAALQKQIASGKVIKATVSPQKHTVKVKLANAKTYSATFAPSQQEALVASLKAKHVKVHVDKKKKKSSHIRYRYVALIVIAVAAVAGLIYYLVRGRRRAGGPGQPPTVIEPGPSAGRPDA
jgi:ATP-dependent Zn protease